MVKPAGTINVGLKELGPFFVQSTLPIGEGLLSQDLDHQTQPLLAEPWSISEDFLTWTFKLHKGIQFHKGYGEMTADDVVWSMQGFQHSKHPRAGQLKRFWNDRGGSFAPDRYTLVGNTGKPVVELIAVGWQQRRTVHRRCRRVRSPA